MVDVLQLQPELLRNHLAAGQHRNVLQHRLAAIAEARRLDGAALQDAADLVDDQRRQRLALDVLGDDQQRLAGLRDLLEQRDACLEDADLAIDISRTTRSSSTASIFSASVMK